ncbi:MAG: D-alanine--D-alanine ligase, partial [Campylobacterales bacterium]
MRFILLFGGSSFEHEISIVSAITLKERINKHQLEFVFLDRDRQFYQVDPTQMRSNYFSSGTYKKGRRVELRRGGFFQVGILGNRRKLPG